MTVQQLQLTPENVKTVAGRAHVHAVVAAPGDKSLRDDFETWIAVALAQNELAHGLLVTRCAALEAEVARIKAQQVGPISDALLH